MTNKEHIKDILHYSKPFWPITVGCLIILAVSGQLIFIWPAFILPLSLGINRMKFIDPLDEKIQVYERRHDDKR